jgi:hypothetical protein
MHPVESSRLGTRERVVKFLALASVLAFRIHWLTIASRKNPESSCESEFSSDEWKPLAILNGNKINNETPPTIKEMTRWIAKLGGFMDRKGDGDSRRYNLMERAWKIVRIFARLAASS